MMTCSTHPAIPQDFAIQVAENEGMPPRPKPSNASLQSIARARRLTGTRKLGPPKTHSAANDFCSGKERSIQPLGKPKRHPLARAFSRLAVLAGLIASLAFPAFAQDVRAPMPAHAQPKSYGEGWECDRGYRRETDKCLAVIVPENAFATNRTYGAGWECLHGFREVEDAVCIKVVVPDGGYLDPSGKSWSCLRGYTEIEGLCAQVVLPSNAYLSDEVYGSDWLCERGYEVKGDTCAAIAVPQNAFLNDKKHGQPWTCARGYFESKARCETIAVPENAFLDDASYGPGWTCERGFAAFGDGCTVIDLPDNAHLDRSGTRWECHDNFQRSQGRCVLNE